MVNPKASSRKPKSAVGRDRYTAELSTGQLVIGVCILLMFGLGCFLLGVLIGKFDPTLQDDSMIAGAPVESGSLDTPPNTPPATPERTQVPPVENNGLRPEDRPPPHIVEQSAPAPANAPAPKTASAETPPDSATDQTPGASNGSDTPEREGVAAATPPTSPPKEPEPVKTAEVSPKPEPARAVQATPDPPKPEPPRSEPPKPAVASPATPGLVYGVQIIAVARPRAEGVKRDIEARTKYKAQIIPIDGDRLCKVVLGRFTDKASAELVRNEMRNQHPFSDAFVIVLQ